MKKALIVTTVSGFVPQFEMNNVRILQRLGYEVHYASNFRTPVYGKDNRRLDGSGVVRHQVDFVRSPFRVWENVRAYGQLKRVIEKGDYDLIHCHTPMGGALARLAAHRAGVRAKVVYTAHGFHFYKGAPVWNWMIYYPVERWLARYTDVIITINKEDFRRACKFRVRKLEGVFWVRGVGISVTEVDKNIINHFRESIDQRYNLEHKQIILSVGELSKRKNHKIAINTIYRMRQYFKKTGKKYPYCYIICGQGKKKKSLQKLVKRKKLEKEVIFYGYCEHITEMLANSELFFFPSKQEGLPVAVLEAMAAGLPVVASSIRGNSDLIVDGKGGFLVRKNKACLYSKYLLYLLENPEVRRTMGNWNREYVKKYRESEIMKKMEYIYTLLE